MNATYSLADIDGTLCVAIASPDYNEPTIVTNYYPTPHATRDLLRFYEQSPEQLAEWEVKQSRPGEYWVSHKQAWGTGGRYIELIGGGRAMPIKGDTRPAPKPRVGKATRLEWSAGKWWKETKRGRQLA